MKKQLFIFLALAGMLTSIGNAQAQESSAQDSVRKDLLYSMSAFGFAFPIGQTSEYFQARFSTALGANIGLGKKGWFLYPKVSLQAYRYNELYPEESYTTRLNNGRATTYLGNLMLGYRATAGEHWAFYGFAGGGGGLILTSQVRVDNQVTQATLNNRNNWMATIEGGAGIEYSLGDATLFIESSYLRGFTEIQGRTFNAVPVYVGIKPNLSKLLLRLEGKK